MEFPSGCRGPDVRGLLGLAQAGRDPAWGRSSAHHPWQVTVSALRARSHWAGEQGFSSLASPSFHFEEEEFESQSCHFLPRFSHLHKFAGGPTGGL